MAFNLVHSWFMDMVREDMQVVGVSDKDTTSRRN